MTIFKAEVIGTALLILLGDGVVAAVLLAKSKAQNAGWIVITWVTGIYNGKYIVNFELFSRRSMNAFLYFIGFTHSLRGHLFEANRASRRLARNLSTSSV